MALALFLTCAAVFGRLVNYFGGDEALFGGTRLEPRPGISLGGRRVTG